MFDIIGSAAYSFTTRPTPTDGSQGNNATCTAQEFFIQVRTVAAYMNVSLPLYYYLAIIFVELIGIVKLNKILSL